MADLMPHEQLMVDASRESFRRCDALVRQNITIHCDDCIFGQWCPFWHH